MIDEKLDAQKTTIIKVINERQTIHLTAMDSFVKTRLKDQDHLVKSELNKVDTTLANNQLREEGRLESIMDIRLGKYTNDIGTQIATVNARHREETNIKLNNMEDRLDQIIQYPNTKKQCPNPPENTEEQHWFLDGEDLILVPDKIIKPLS